MPEGATYDKGGSTIIVDDELFNFVLGLLNSSVYLVIAGIFNPTLNFQVMDIRNLPIIELNQQTVNEKVENSIAISSEDWNSFETSWDFKKHPLI